MSSERNATRLLLLLLPWLLTLGACASAQLYGSPEEGPSSAKILLGVENRNVADARVFLVRSGVRLRLGTVGAHERRTFSIDRSLLGGVGEFSLDSELLASRRRHRTPPIVATAGDHVELVIGHRLSLSRVVVRR